MATAAMAWYIMAHIIYADLFGRDILPGRQAPDQLGEVAAAGEHHGTVTAAVTPDPFEQRQQESSVRNY
ncbi:MAG: hypothetical protein IPL11_16465 [Candidatus Accumulibacter sp.]|nr:hypothetical protein [Accumulibacter sp.]